MIIPEKIADRSIRTANNICIHAWMQTLMYLCNCVHSHFLIESRKASMDCI